MVNTCLILSVIEPQNSEKTCFYTFRLGYLKKPDGDRSSDHARIADFDSFSWIVHIIFEYTIHEHIVPNGPKYLYIFSNRYSPASSYPQLKSLTVFQSIQDNFYTDPEHLCALQHML